MKQFKKKTKKKKKQIDDEIVPTKHEKVGNINFYSEEVSKEIIEQLISLAISSHFTNKVEKKFNDFCYNEILQKLTNFIKINYIGHETDDFENNNYVLSKIKYQKTDTNINRYKIKKHEKALNQRNKCANAVLLDIANVNKDEEIEMFVKNKKIDDFLNKSNLINNKIDLVKRYNIQFDIKIKDNNFWGEIIQPKSFRVDRTSTKFNILKNQKDNSNKIIENENLTSSKYNNNEALKRKYSMFLNQKSKKIKQNYNVEISKKQKKFNPVLEMPFIEIPEEVYNKNKETEEIKQLRKETLEHILAKEEELKKYNKNKKIKAPIKNSNIKGKFCTDCEGKIVMIKEIRPESLLKEFWPISSNQKEILGGKSFQSFLKENYILEQKANKNIIYNNGNFINLLNSNTLSTKEKEMINEFLKKNGKNTIDGNINLMKEELFNIQPPPISHLSPRNERIEPSGSNFKIINPSVGVNIKEKNKVKVGGDNFFEKFHKYSINEFNKTLKETLEWETKIKLKGNLISNFNNNYKNIIKEENNENEKSNKKEKILRKTFSGGFNTRKNILKSNSDVFTINEKYPVLQDILLHDVEFDINNKHKLKEKSLSNENLFDRDIKSSLGRIINKNKKIKYDMIDDFNRELIMGNFIYNKSRKQFLPKLPPKQNKIILPNLLNNYNNFNKTANNFYRTRQKRNNDILSNISSPLSANNKAKRINVFSKDNN